MHSGGVFIEAEILDFMIDICNAVHECHMKDIVHKDLKPLNILNSNGKLKLCDFGIARVLETTQDNIHTNRLSRAYAAPEVLDKKGFRFTADIWSLGCILYELCALKQPYKIKYQKGMQYDLIPIQKYSSQIQTLISELLQEKPEFRPSINIVTRNYYIIYIINDIIYIEKLNDIKEHQETIRESYIKIQNLEREIQRNNTTIEKLEKEKEIDSQKIIDLEKEKSEKISENIVDKGPAEEEKEEDFILC